MSLLTICQAAAAELKLGSIPTSVIGSNDVDAQTLLRFATRVGADLATRAPWQALRLQHSFVAVADEVQPLAVPTGFLRFSPETIWDVTNGISITGPIDPVEYQSRKNDYTASGYIGPMRWFTRRGNDFLVWPIPNGGETYVFEYQSGAYCQSAAGTPQASWQADTDTGRISEELMILGIIARYLESDGQPWQAARGDFERRLTIEIRNDAPSARVLAAGDIFGTGRRFTGEPGSGSGGTGGTGSGGGWTWG